MMPNPDIETALKGLGTSNSLIDRLAGYNLSQPEMENLAELLLKASHSKEYALIVERIISPSPSEDQACVLRGTESAQVSNYAERIRLEAGIEMLQQLRLEIEEESELLKVLGMPFIEKIKCCASPDSVDS